MFHQRKDTDGVSLIQATYLLISLLKTERVHFSSLCGGYTSLTFWRAIQMRMTQYIYHLCSWKTLNLITILVQRFSIQTAWFHSDQGRQISENSLSLYFWRCFCVEPHAFSLFFAHCGIHGQSSRCRSWALLLWSHGHWTLPSGPRAKAKASRTASFDLLCP